MVEILAGADAALVDRRPQRDASRLAYGKDMVIWTKRRPARGGTAAQRTGVRRLRHRRAGICLERLRRHRCARQDRGGAGQRSGIRLQGSQGVQGRRHDLLRPLGLQDRGGRAAGRRGRAADSRCRCGRATAGTWSRAPGAARNWNSPRRTAMPAARPSKAGCRRMRRARCSLRRGSIWRRPQRPPRRIRDSRRCRWACSVDATLHNSVRQFNSANVIALLPGGSRHTRICPVHRALGFIWAATPRAPATTYSMARSTMPSGVAGLLAWRSPSCAPSRVADRSIVFLALTGGGIRSAGLPSTTSRTRSSRCGKPRP